MGYRSEVCIGMTDDATRLFRTILEHLPATHPAHELLAAADSGLSEGEEHKNPDVDCHSKLYWNGVKWYEGYDCVDFIESFLADCIPEEDYRFVRVGEDTDDNDERGDFWEADIHISRHITW